MSAFGHQHSGGQDIAICIPARDEAKRLPRLFAAIEQLIVPDDAMVSVCLLLDGCVDDSAALASTYALRSRHRVHISECDRMAPNAGRARGLAMRAGIAAVCDGDAILLTTDADSVPAPDWLLAMLSALCSADVVAGDVRRDVGADDIHQDRIESYYARLFALRRRIDPVAWEAVPTHHHASGANIGMRSSTYQSLGGFPWVASGEDARLIDDASRAGLRVRRDAASVVHTSARRSGRAQGGLATMLREIDRRGLEGVTVAHPVDQSWQYRMQAQARSCFATGDFISLATDLRLTTDHMLGVARDCPNEEAFAMRVVPEPSGGMRMIAFPAAETALAGIAAPVVSAQAA